MVFHKRLGVSQDEGLTIGAWVIEERVLYGGGLEEQTVEMEQLGQ